jgi:hypothetical protein
MAMNFSITSYEKQAMKPEFHLWMSNQRAVKAVDAHTFAKQAEKV